MYEAKVAESVYAVTGQNDTDQDVLQFLATTIRSYLLTLKKDVEEQFRIRQVNRKGCRSKQVRVEDIYLALEGTPEMYGVKRCVILKSLAKSADETQKPEVGDEAESPDDTLDSYQSQLRALDDGSDAYRTFEASRLQDLVDADELTQRMTLEEYLAYSKRGKTAFVDRPKAFCEWLDWTPRPSRIILTAFGWLATYRIKQLINRAIKRKTAESDKLHVSLFQVSEA